MIDKMDDDRFGKFRSAAAK